VLSYADYMKIFVGLVAIVNPIGAIPIFIGRTSGMAESDRRVLTNRVTATVAWILLLSLAIGEQMLAFFGISIHSFRVGGGILILLVAVSMLHARTSGTAQTSDEARETAEKASIAVVPLAIPLLAGPGAISTVILDAHKGSGIIHYSVVALSIVILTAILWLSLRLSPYISRHVSVTGINVFTRIMGLILAAIAVEFIANGLKGLFPGLA
jgi:multiple antibiotic resistance protein